MENAVVSIIPIAMIITAMVTLAGSGFSSFDQVSASWKELGTSDMAASSRLTVEDTSVQGEIVKITLRNRGPVSLSDFPNWDVIVQYYPATGYRVRWLPYSSGPLSENQWVIAGIYQDAQTSLPEVLQPGILDPGEEVVLEFKVNPALGVNKHNWATIGPSRAVPVSVYFSS